jgi:hypothetical protein
MKAGPSCPIHLGTLDSPDYWTDNALVAAVQPASEVEWRHWATWSREQQARRRTRELPR